MPLSVPPREEASAIRKVLRVCGWTAVVWFTLLVLFWITSSIVSLRVRIR